MQFIFISCVLLFITGCMETTEVSPSKKLIAQNQIQSNKTEAEAAQEAYIKLQKQRSKESS